MIGIYIRNTLPDKSCLLTLDKAKARDLLKVKEVRQLLLLWVAGELKVKLPEDPIFLAISAGNSNLYYRIPLDELNHKPNPDVMGLLKFFIYIDIAMQLGLLGEGYRGKRAPQMVMGKLCRRLDKAIIREFSWRQSQLSVLATLEVDAFLKNAESIGSLECYCGDQNQMVLAEAVQKNDLNHLYSALSVLGWIKKLGYQQISLLAPALKRLQKILDENWERYRGN